MYIYICIKSDYNPFGCTYICIKSDYNPFGCTYICIKSDYNPDSQNQVGTRITMRKAVGYKTSVLMSLYLIQQSRRQEKLVLIVRLEQTHSDPEHLGQDRDLVIMGRWVLSVYTHDVILYIAMM